MSHNHSDLQIPNRDHMISAKAATLILRGIIAAGEPPNNIKTERVDAHQTATRSGQQSRLDLATPAGVPDAKVRTAVAIDAKSTRPRRKAKAEDGMHIPPVKKCRKE